MHLTTLLFGASHHYAMALSLYV